MGERRTILPVTPLVAMLAARVEYIDAARAPLRALLGPIEFESERFPFERTEYYDEEMGTGLFRQFFTFERKADPAELADWKVATNALEKTLAPILAPSGTPRRPLNLDPGYVTSAKLLLASTKDFAHRIYLRDGIFAEITLNFRAGKWLNHMFTFPDFKSGRYDAFLKKVRDHYMHTTRLERAAGIGWKEEDE
jgi:hypothetical protein